MTTTTTATMEAKPRYVDFLKLIANDRFNVHPVIEYDALYREDKINVLLRHDADFSNGYGMAKLDHEAGIRSTFYLRLHALEYAVDNVAKFYQGMESQGYEIGYHYEVMDQCHTSIVDKCALDLFKLELAKLRTYFKVGSVAPHGGNWNHLLEENSAWASLSRECDVISAYRIPFLRKVNYRYLSDSSREFAAGGLQYFRTELQKQKPGDVVQILVHPHPPRWDYEVYKNDLPPLIPAPEIPETPFLTILSLLASILLLAQFRRKEMLGRGK